MDSVDPLRNRPEPRLLHDVGQRGVAVRGGGHWRTRVDRAGPDVRTIGPVLVTSAREEIRQRLGRRRCLSRPQSSAWEMAADGLLRRYRRPLIRLLLVWLQVEQVMCVEAPGNSTLTVWPLTVDRTTSRIPRHGPQLFAPTVGEKRNCVPRGETQCSPGAISQRAVFSKRSADISPVMRQNP